MGLFDKLFGKKEETFDPNHIFAPMAGQLMKLMSLGVKQGDVVTVAAEGANEDAAIAALTAFFNNNL